MSEWRETTMPAEKSTWLRRRYRRKERERERGGAGRRRPIAENANWEQPKQK